MNREEQADYVIKELRIRGKSFTQIAEGAGVTSATVSNIWNRRTHRTATEGLGFGGKYVREPKARIIANMKVDENTGCWLWKPEKLDRESYGIIMIDKKPRKIHRYSYELHKGKIPGNKFVCHTCDTPACVNPDHLFVGTAKDNVHDMISKGRGHWQGKSSKKSKTTKKSKDTPKKRGFINNFLDLWRT